MIVYTSRTGNVKHIVNQLNLPNVELREGLIISQPYILFTYTDGLGSSPRIVEEFLDTNDKYIKGIIVSGNVNFGEFYCKPAEVISERYNIPIVRKIDLRGTDQDVKEIIKQYNDILR